MLMSLLLFLVLLAVVFYHRLPLLAGSVTMVIGSAVLAVLAEGAWLWFILTIVVAVVLNV